MWSLALFYMIFRLEFQLAAHIFCFGEQNFFHSIWLFFNWADIFTWLNSWEWLHKHIAMTQWRPLRSNTDSQIPTRKGLKLVQAAPVVTPRGWIIVCCRWIGATFRDRQVNQLGCFPCIQTIIKSYKNFSSQVGFSIYNPKARCNPIIKAFRIKSLTIEISTLDGIVVGVS